MRYIILLICVLAMLPASAHKIRIGSGSGNITVNNFAATYGLKDGDTVIINHGPGAGVYDYFAFSNSSFRNRLYILASDSGVRFTVCCGGYSSISNCRGLRLEGFKIWRGAYRGIDITGNTDNIYFKNISFRALKDWGVYIHGLDKYNGTEATRNDNITFDHCRFDSMPVGVCISFANATRNTTIQYCHFENTWEVPKLGSNIIYFQLIATRVSFHDNTFKRSNLRGVSHNALVYVKGNGRFYNNYSFDRQGDFFRCFPYTEVSPGSPRDTLFIYNNRDVSARKYATVELQQMAADTSATIRPAIAYVVGNTGGNFRTADYFPFVTKSGGGGSQIDVYDMFTNFYIWNNLAFGCYIDSIPNPGRIPARYSFNYQLHDGGGTRPRGVGRFGDTANNLYAHSPAALGITDTLTMHISGNSPARNRGRAALFFNTDYKGTKRPNGNGWDVGAVQAAGSPGKKQ